MKAAKYAKDESALQSKLATVIRRESEAAERDRQKAIRREQARVDRMVNAVEGTMDTRFAELRGAKRKRSSGSYFSVLRVRVTYASTVRLSASKPRSGPPHIGTSLRDTAKNGSNEV